MIWVVITTGIAVIVILWLQKQSSREPEPEIKIMGYRLFCKCGANVMSHQVDRLRACREFSNKGWFLTASGNEAVCPRCAKEIMTSSAPSAEG